MENESSKKVDGTCSSHELCATKYFYDMEINKLISCGICWQSKLLQQMLQRDGNGSKFYIFSGFYCLLCKWTFDFYFDYAVSDKLTLAADWDTKPAIIIQNWIELRLIQRLDN